MYIVNTTFVIDPAAHEPWLKLMREHYIPSLQQAGYLELTFTRLIREEAPGDFTYSLQAEASSLDDYRRISNELLSQYETIAREWFDNRVQWFTSLLKRVEY